MRLLLVGAGGHARTVMDAVAGSGHEVVAYAAPEPSAWLDLPRIGDDEAQDMIGAQDLGGFIMGIGGVTGDGLKTRLALHRRYAGRGLAPVALEHAAAYVAPGVDLGAGAVVLARAAVNPNAQIGEAAIVNTGAIIEHDSAIGAGAHVAPGAIVLGGAAVGACAMVGAGAVILPGAAVPDGALVPALGRFPA